MEDKYKEYDAVMQSVMLNVEVEHGRNGKYLLYDFHPEVKADQLYYNATTIAADLNHEKIYIDMPFFKFIKFWIKRRKRKNLYWFTPFNKRKLDDEHKTSVYIIMDFIREAMNLDEKIFEEINSEYYGGVDGKIN